MLRKFLHLLKKKKIKNIINQFHVLYYNSLSQTWNNTYWMGIPVLKCPLDLWIYQEIIFKTRPDIIIECGTAKGGSALYLASVCDLVNNGRVITVDIEDNKDKPKHKRITYLLGSSISKQIIEKIKKLVGNKKIMVILDSDHSKQHVLSELKIYSKFVTKESYLIVEDTNINNHPVLSNFGPGPMEALKEFLKENKNFIIDKEEEKFYLTFNPKGYLKKIK